MILPGLVFDEIVDQFRPLDAGVDLDQPPPAIEAADAIELCHVEQHRVAAELLPAHRVASARYAHGPAFALRRPQRGMDVADRAGTDYVVDCAWR